MAVRPTGPCCYFNPYPSSRSDEEKGYTLWPAGARNRKARRAIRSNCLIDKGIVTLNRSHCWFASIIGLVIFRLDRAGYSGDASRRHGRWPNLNSFLPLSWFLLQTFRSKIPRRIHPMTIISSRDESPIGSMPSDRMRLAGACSSVDERMSRASGTSGLLLF